MNMPAESSQQPTRETATGGASRAVLEYGWASPLAVTVPWVRYLQSHPFDLIQNPFKV